MLAIRQKAVRYAARPGGYRALSRYSTGQHGKEGHEVKHSAGTSTEHGHHHAGPKNEPLGVRANLNSIDPAADGFLGSILHRPRPHPRNLRYISSIADFRRWHDTRALQDHRQLLVLQGAVGRQKCFAYSHGRAGGSRSQSVL
jgi:hypothetical protein